MTTDGTNHALNVHLVEQTPLRVKVIGTANGDVAVVESLGPEGSPSVTLREAGRTVDHGPAEVLFDVRYQDDHGKLVVTANGFEDVSDAEHSRRWSYAQIKELREGGNEIKIETHSGDSFEFRVDRPGMSDTVYKTLEDQTASSLPAVVSVCFVKRRVSSPRVSRKERPGGSPVNYEVMNRASSEAKGDIPMSGSPR